MAANVFDQFDQQAANPFDQFDAPVAQKPEKTGMLRAAADIPVQVGRGVAVGVKALSDVFGADNPVSRAASGVEDFLGGLLSAQAKNDQAEIARIMKEAQDKGVGDQVTAAVKAFATAPVDMLSQALGTAVPVIAGGLAGSVARLGAMGVGAIGTGVGAAIGAGTVKGQIYDAVKQELLANKVPEAEAEKRAQEAQAYGGQNLDQILMGAGIGAAEAAFGAERILTGLLRKGAVKPSTLPAKYRIPTAAATEAVPEMAQAAQEQVAQNIALQREGYDVPTMRGVVGQAALEGIAGMGLGAITGAVQRTVPEAKVTKEAKTPEGKVAGRTTVVTDEETAARLREEQAAEPQQAEAEAPKPVTGEAGIVRPEEETQISREVAEAAEPEIEPTRQIKSAELMSPPTPQEISQSAASTEQNVPSEGMVRMYHGGRGPEELTGPVWFTLDRRNAEGWAKRDPSMNVWYVDVPERVLVEQYGYATIKQARDDGYVPVPNLELPDDFAKNRKPLPLAEKKAPVSGRVEEGAAVRPEVSPEPGITEDRQRAEPVVEAAAPEPVVTEAEAMQPEPVAEIAFTAAGAARPEVQTKTETAETVKPELQTSPRIAELQKQYDSINAEIEALGPEPFKYSAEKKFFGVKGREGAPPEAVAIYDRETKKYNSWRRKYLSLKKKEVEVSNALFREKQKFEPKKSLRATPDQQVRDFEQTLRTSLNKFGLKDVGVKLIGGMREEGSYAQQLIRIAADSANPIRTLRHEAIHALRELGFFTDAQWQSLSKMAKDKWIDQYLKQRNVDGKPLKAGEESRYDAYMREYEGDMEKITEESVADAFADFDATKPPAGLVSSLLTRLRNLFQAIKSALTNVESPEQIFGKVERGELSKGKSLERTEELASLKYANDYVKRADQLDRAFTQMGLHVIRESSKASGSEYVEASDDEYQKTGGNNGKKLKFRISDHPLPLSYAQPDFDVLADADKKHANVSGNWMEAVEFAANYFNIEAPKLVTAARAKESLLNKRAKESAKTKLESIAQQEINNLQNWMNDQDVIIKRSSSKLQGYLEKNGKVIFTLIYAQGPNGKVPADKEQAIKNQISKLQSNLSGERKSLREQPYRGQVGKETPPTPTTAGQSALDTINQLGMGVKEPEGNLYEQAKKKFKAMGESPAGTKAEIKEAVRKFFANIETKTMSSDARWDSDIKNGLRQDMKPVEDIIGASLLASQSQAVGADAVSTRAMLIGGATYDEKAMKWVAYENKDANEVVKAKVLDEIAAKYGLTKEEASQVAHTYLVAANYEGIIKRNAKLEEQIKALKEEGKNDEADDLEAALVFVSEKQAAMVEPGKSIADTIPEVKKIAKIWNEQRRMVKDAMVFSGLWRPEYADAMMDNAAYVPFYRETQIDADEGPRIFMRGLQVKAKEHKLKGSETAVNNVFENMAMWQQYAMNRAIRNHKAVQSIDVGKTIQVGDRKMAEQVKEPKRGMNVVKIWREGKQEFYEVADPYYVEAFQTLGAVYIEPIKYFTAISNILRKTVVMYPLFSIGQLTQDSVAAIFASGLKPQHAFKIPYLAVKEFGKTMMGWSTTHDELKNYGAVGVRDFNAAVAREDAAITAGVKAPRGAWGKVNYMLERVAMSADNAVRQAMYIASTEAGLTKAEALEKAFEIINFRRRGSSKMLQLMGQTVPFFYAYLSAQRVAYKTLTLSGISPTERKAALETLAQTTAAVMALSFIYAMANGDDEEYKKTPSTIRDRSLMIPGSGGVRIPLRPDFFLFPKVIAEHTYQLLTDEGYSDGAKFRKSMADLLANATLSPNAVPQIIKPTFEAAINYSFFEGKPIVGFFEQNKEAGRQFNDSTSEMAKWFGQFGASPQMVDHLIRGYFGSVGGLTLWGTNFFIEGEPGVPRPEITAHDMFVIMPGVGAFKQKPTENALKVDFYELRDAIAKVKNTYDDMKVRSPEGLEAFIQDEKNLARLAMDKQITKIGDHLSKIRRAIQQVAAAPESRMSASEKQERIKELRDIEMELLKAVDVKALRAQAKL